MNRFAAAMAANLNVRLGEGKPLLILLAHAFCMGIGFVFFEAPANALFLAAFDVAALPYVYMISALVTVVIGTVFARCEGRVAPSHMFIAILLMMAGITTLLYLGTVFTASRWVGFGLMIWKDVQFILTGYEFWAVAGAVFDLRQGKRLFGLIGAGEIAAVVLGGALTPLLTDHFGVAPLMLIAVAGHLGALAALVVIVRATPSSFAVAGGGEEDAGAQAPRRPLKDLLSDRYIALFFAISIMSYLGYYFVDYIFYDRVEATFTDPEKLANFFGVFLGVCGTINLVSNIFLSGPILGRFGVRVGILMLPAFVVLGTAAMTVTTIIGAAVAVVAACAIATKLMDEVLRKSMEGPIYRILYQPLPTLERLRVQTLRESIVEAGSIGFAGAVLALLTSGFGLSVEALIWVLIGVLTVWLTAAVLLGRAYGGQLIRAVSSRRFAGQESLLRDGASLAAFEQFLTSDIPADVIYSLEMIDGIAPDRLPPLLPPLLRHRDAGVRRHVLQLLEKYHAAELAEPVQAMLAAEIDPEVCAAALRTLCAMLESDAIDSVLPFTDADDFTLRRGAMVGLLRHGGIEGLLSAGRKLYELLEAPDSARRILAASIVGDVGIRSFYRPLTRLLADTNTEVRRAALIAAGHLAEPRLGVPLVENLRSPALLDAAMTSLVHLGDAALPALSAALILPGATATERQRLVRIVGRIRTPAGIATLLAHLDQPEVEVTAEIVRALVAGRYRAAPAELSLWEGRLRLESLEAAHCCAAIRDLAGTQGTERLVAALRTEVARCREQVLDILSFIAPQQTLLDAKRRLSNPNPSVRGTAIELLDTILPAAIKRDIFPLIDDSNADQQALKLLSQFPVEQATVSERLTMVLARAARASSGWTKACVLEFLVRHKHEATPALRAAVMAAAVEPRPVVRETAVWCLGRLGKVFDAPDVLACLTARQADPDAAVAALARQTLAAAV